MRRRAFILALGAAVAAPLVGRAQPERKKRLATMVTTASDAEVSETGNQPWRAFFTELRRLGYEEGRTLVVERWSGRGNTARYPALAREVAGSNPDVICATGLRLALALQAATSSIPIVITGGNLVERGLADSLSRPGRNVTGVSTAFGWEYEVKCLELLREAVPIASRIGFLAARAAEHIDLPYMREAAARLGVTLVEALLDDPIQPPEYQRVFAAIPDQRIDALMVADYPENFTHRQLIIELATASRLPTIATSREFVELGGLMSYGTDLSELGRLMAGYVPRVLQGEKPADMPIRLMDKIELIINLKTARELGIEMPTTFLARADEVIE
jgi:putative ABC transport system substrate-binding protein